MEVTGPNSEEGVGSKTSTEKDFICENEVMCVCLREEEFLLVGSGLVSTLPGSARDL